MEVILLEKIAKLGDLGDKVKVKPGYGRNYLIPFKKAIPATEANLAEFENRRAELQALADERMAAALERAQRLEELDITIMSRAGEEGKLFGSIGTRDIAEAVAREGVELSKSEVLLPDGPIRELGEYEIGLSLHSEVSVTLKLGIVAA